RYFEIGHDWLGRRVFEQRQEREREEDQRRQKQEAEAKLAKERARQRTLMIIAGVSLAGLVVSGTLGVLALRARRTAEQKAEEARAAQTRAEQERSEAHDAQIMAGFRELKGAGQLSWAMKLLPEVEHPERQRGWVALASDALNQSALRA